MSSWVEGVVTISSAFLTYICIETSNRLWIFFLISGLFAKYLVRTPYLFLTPLRDFVFFSKYSRIWWYSYYYKKNRVTLVDLFYENLNKYPNKPCFYFEDSVWTFTQVEEWSNRVANVFSQAGFSKGDVVALIMENRPEYPIIWLGLAKIGVATSLINTNLRQDSLRHSLKVVQAKGLIVTRPFFTALNEIASQIAGQLQIYSYETTSPENFDSLNNELNAKILSELLANAPDKRPTISLTFHDPVLYIYTSGTTGLPKAARMPNSRIIMASVMVKYGINLSPEVDIMYSPMPLYHSTSGVVGVATALFLGVPVILRSKFSASNFWKDCIQYNCTASQYIGEMCRYLLTTPESPLDRQHKVRVFFGNGVRPQVWERMMQRFGIKEIKELYGATEGNANMINFDNKIGSVGFIPNIIPDCLNPLALLKFDSATGLPLRNRKGFCERAEIGKPGLLVSRIRDNIIGQFHGYVDQNESEKKIFYDIFKKGDRYFNSGDILEKDVFGYFYFKDRIGDTYRWKGENVSTTEIENILSSLSGDCEVCVFGVEIPDCEGRVGMAAIVDNNNQFNVKKFSKEIERGLPSYARPMFIRIVREMDLTVTFKMKKHNLQKEGFDICNIQDPIYIYQNFSYVPLTEDLYKLILEESIKL